MLKPLSPADGQRLREFLAEADYTQAGFRKSRIPAELPTSGAQNLRDHIREPSTLNLLLRWFFLGSPVARESIAGLAPEPVLALLVESGMLAADGNMLAPAVMLTPSDRCVFAADTAARMDSHASDLVIWPNPTTLLLQLFTIRRPVQTALDLGGGCGIQAVLAAAHSRQVTATDLNPRAAEFTRFNAWLNGFENIECLTGDTFDPVQNRTFDLILANLPFFVTPSADRLYCENGMELDQYCRRVAREAPGHLNEGGYLQAVLEWVEVRGQSWQERILEWVEGSGCDAWIFRGYARAAEDYARERLRQGGTAGPDNEALKLWMDYYGQRGVEQIHGGILALRRRAGRNWVRMEDMAMNSGEPFGEAVEQAFACIDLLELHGSDEQLLGARPRLAPNTQLDQQLRQADGRWQSVGMTLRFTSGIQSAMRLDPPVADFLARLDGRHSLDELIRELASQVKADPQTVQNGCLTAVRRLIERRFVVP